MANALWITLIGMSLVFLAILLLWGLMALLVRLTAEKPALSEEIVAAVEFEPAPEADDALELRKRVAVAAVAVALGLQTARKGQNGHAAGQAERSVSAWQAVNRAGQLNQRMNITRKQGTR